MPQKLSATAFRMSSYAAVCVAALVLGIGSVTAQATGALEQKAPSNKSQPAAPRQTAPAPVGADLTREKFLLQMDSDFRIRDANADGQISRIEIENYERRLALDKAVAANRDLFNRLDRDRNNVLTPNEFLALVNDNSVVDVSKTMQRFDKNRDQVITLVEYRTATLSNFDQLDRDKDGKLSQSEINYFKLDKSNSNDAR